MSREIKELAHVRVKKQTLQGLYVVLDNGESGIIRIREISWKSKDIASWRENFPIGWEGYAFSIPMKKGGTRELSLRLVDDDPWDDFFEGREKNQVFEGVVTGVYDYGAFIEIKPGVAGLLHKSQIPTKIQSSVLELFWHGDKVFVTISNVNHEQRQIGLSLIPMENLLDKISPIERNYLTVKYEAKFSLENILNADFPHKHILVVEDDVPQSNSVCGWLREFGQNVDAVFSAKNALEFLAKTRPDIVLADVGLPGMSGVELAQIILKNYPQIQVVNATDWARASEMNNSLEDVQAQGGKLLYKPLLPEDLANYLLYDQDQGYLVQKPEQQVITIPSKGGSRRELHNLLVMYQKKLGVEQVFLFSLDPAHRKVSILERAGDGMVNKNAIAGLIHSPVRDAAEDGESMFVNEIGERERKRFQYLLEFSPAAVACIGIPIPAQSTLKYALFAMDRRARQFGDEIKMYVEGMALAIGAMLDQVALKDRSTLIQRSALIGNLTSGMIHEINNLVAPLQFEFNNLKKNLARIEKEPGYSHETIKAETANIEQDIRQIISTVYTFGRIAKKPQVEILKVDEIIKDTLTLLSQISKRARVKMYFDAPEKMVVVRNQAVVLEQIILNVSLNAIQQIAEHRTENDGHIRIDLEAFNDSDDGTMCRILVADNGPGIHATLWEKVFEMGFSTRQDGSGIGLFVSRNLMEEIGGRIYVADSHILYGSTFALEFPAQL